MRAGVATEDILKLTEMDAIPILKLYNKPLSDWHNKEFRKTTKHTNAILVRESGSEGLVSVQKVDSVDQLTDILTKGVSNSRLQRFCGELGLAHLSALNKR